MSSSGPRRAFLSSLSSERGSCFLASTLVILLILRSKKSRPLWMKNTSPSLIFCPFSSLTSSTSRASHLTGHSFSRPHSLHANSVVTADFFLGALNSRAVRSENTESTTTLSEAGHTFNLLFFTAVSPFVVKVWSFAEIAEGLRYSVRAVGD